jgi:hypothetical protein
MSIKGKYLEKASRVAIAAVQELSYIAGDVLYPRVGEAHLRSCVDILGVRPRDCGKYEVGPFMAVGAINTIANYLFHYTDGSMAYNAKLENRLKDAKTLLALVLSEATFVPEDVRALVKKYWVVDKDRDARATSSHIAPMDQAAVYDYVQKNPEVWSVTWTIPRDGGPAIPRPWVGCDAGPAQHTGWVSYESYAYGAKKKSLRRPSPQETIDQAINDGKITNQVRIVAEFQLGNKVKVTIECPVYGSEETKKEFFTDSEPYLTVRSVARGNLGNVSPKLPRDQGLPLLGTHTIQSTRLRSGEWRTVIKPEVASGYNTPWISDQAAHPRMLGLPWSGGWALWLIEGMGWRLVDTKTETLKSFDSAALNREQVIAACVNKCEREANQGGSDTISQPAPKPQNSDEEEISPELLDFLIKSGGDLP